MRLAPRLGTTFCLVFSRLCSAEVTITANDSCPEMLAAIRRGPFATPCDEEFLEYLLSTKRKDQARPRFEEHCLEHVLSFQRRVHATKKQFFSRATKTPLGRVQEYWDRTEAACLRMLISVKRSRLRAFVLTFTQSAIACVS